MVGEANLGDNSAHKHTLVYVGGSCVFVLVLIIIIIVVILRMRRSSMRMLKYTNVKRVIVMRPVSIMPMFEPRREKNLSLGVLTRSDITSLHS